MANYIENIDKTFYEETGIRLQNVSYLRLFNLVYDKLNNIKFLNIFKTFIVDQTKENKYMFEIYNVDNNDWFDNISAKYYGTPYLWWLIALMNNITNPFEELDPGMQLKMLKKDYIYIGIKEMTEISRL